MKISVLLETIDIFIAQFNSKKRAERSLAAVMQFLIGNSTSMSNSISPRLDLLITARKILVASVKDIHADVFVKHV